jgi:hypothetical protein
MPSSTVSHIITSDQQGPGAVLLLPISPGVRNQVTGVMAIALWFT